MYIKFCVSCGAEGMGGLWQEGWWPWRGIAGFAGSPARSQTILLDSHLLSPRRFATTQEWRGLRWTW